VSQTWQARLLTALYEQHGDALLSFVQRYVPDRSSAEDVVQETLLRAWRHIDRVDTLAGNPRAYLFTVARNILTDQWRAERSRPRLVGDDTTVAAVPSDGDVEAAVERWTVAEALQRLTPEHRAVVQALYFDGHSVAETARQLGVPAGTVKSRSYYAVRALRSALEEMGVLR
jgi:RNA polymerase sigma-70 factor (ECF subfamily)